MSSNAPVFAALCCLTAMLVSSIAQGDENELLWGDTHLHSSYSADSYLDGNFTVDPATAYRYASGQPVIHPFHQARVQIEDPLDFLVVSDHAEFLGGIRQIHQFGIDTADMDFADKIIAWLAEKMFAYVLADGHGMDAFSGFMDDATDPQERAAQLAAEDFYSLPGQPQIVANAWREIAKTADAYNQPGTFSAIIGWEWTATPGGANLHRIVFTDGATPTATRYVPFSRDDSPYPEDLWQWLEQTSAQTGDNFVSIPHNSNLSKGFMFPLQTLRGKAFTTEYLQLRRKWEPVVEASQNKGDSETHPLLSPNDPFADFERYTFYIQPQPESYRAAAGDYVRSGLLRGLRIAKDQGVNPYQFGLIGSTDSHTGLSTPEERNFLGEQPLDSIPANKARGIGGEGSATGWDMAASGLAAVWAQDNTREAILQAFQRREVYATTGPRIAVKLTGFWQTAESATATTTSVPMGGELPHPAPPNATPSFHIHAMKDPRGANLDRIQIIKGWVDSSGNSHEKIYEAAWSGQRELDAKGNLPPVGNTVNEQEANYTNSIGAPTLQASWHDPHFKLKETAFYYARILEIPTPRHSLYDAVALGGDVDTGHPTSIQERAYTSPIWYSVKN